MTVYQQQCLLGYLGYDFGALDGVCGDRTRGALRAFQRDAGMEPDGVCDAETEQKLKQRIMENAARPEQADWWSGIRHFTREEFRCKCGGRYCGGYPDEMKETVVRIADGAREHFGKTAHVVSGLRCPKWNAHEGGVANSQHMYGEAIDLRIDGVSAAQLQAFVRTQPGHRYSYCINGTNVHFDIQPGKRG